MRILVIGREQDSQDHTNWCYEQGHETCHVESDISEASDLGRFDDIVSFHDGHQCLVEKLRRLRGLPTRDMRAVAILTDKSLFKAHVATAPYRKHYLEIATSVPVSEALEDIDAGLPFPVVVKPLNGFYSAGVTRADDAGSLRTAYVRARRIGALLTSRSSPATILIEPYLEGEEFAIDGFIHGARVVPLLFHRKLPRLEGPVFHEVAYATEPFDLVRGVHFQAALDSIVGGIGLDESPFHAEFRYDAGGMLHVLEVAPRLAGGGATTRHLLAICTGLDAYGLLHALGRGPVDLRPRFSHCGLEYDFPAMRSGRVRNLGKLVERCGSLGASVILQHCTDGAMVMSPPMNVEAILTAFFPCDSLRNAIALFQDVHMQCQIQMETI